MSKLTDEQMHKAFLSIAEEPAHTSFEEFMEEGDAEYIREYGRAIEAAATEPLLQRIAELEQRNRDLYEDVQRFKKHALNEKAARMELERQLEAEPVGRVAWAADVPNTIKEIRWSKLAPPVDTLLYTLMEIK